MCNVIICSVAHKLDFTSARMCTHTYQHQLIREVSKLEFFAYLACNVVTAYVRLGGNTSL